MSTEYAKDLLLHAHEEYSRAVSDGRAGTASYWNGYIHGLAQVLNNPQEPRR